MGAQIGTEKHAAAAEKHLSAIAGERTIHVDDPFWQAGLIELGKTLSKEDFHVDSEFVEASCEMLCKYSVRGVDF